MLQFNTLAFLIFFIIFYSVYLVLFKHLKVQNIWLLLASYAFYAFIDWRFLPMIIFMTLTDFSLAWLMGRLDAANPEMRKKRKLLVFLSLAIDLTLLGFFKYFNFFAGSIAHTLDLIGIAADPVTLNILLPLGISFYTLKSLSYTLEVYRGRLEPTIGLLDYAIFIAFFPALLAGPIDRAGKFLPQVSRSRRIDADHFAAGISLILWGYLKKLVIADNLAIIANQVFQNPVNVHGLDIILGTMAFAVQIYCDFSGYSDIARGLARLMGFELMVNFKLPYFALNPADFWQRWHISLSEWLRDYIFFPVRRMVLSWRSRGVAFWGLLVPPLVTMLLSGLWHGAGWNYIFWGLYHGGLMIVYRLLEKIPISKFLETIVNSRFGIYLRMGIMFGFVCLGWLFFRSNSVGQAFQLLTNISLSPSGQSITYAGELIFFTLPLLLIQVWQSVKGDLLVLSKLRLPVQLFVYSLILVWIVVFGARQATEFIYAQF
jgi:D-alanyl-lipoteichoic acid acyltransferase DltB (MBOAT superfamily)